MPVADEPGQQYHLSLIQTECSTDQVSSSDTDLSGKRPSSPQVSAKDGLGTKSFCRNRHAAAANIGYRKEQD
jgi:hypothetical protein